MIQNVSNGGVDEGAAYDVYKKTQMQWVKSPFVLGRAARKPDMMKLQTMKEHKDDPVGYLENKLSVDYPGDAELMRVSIKGTHRDDLATIVNSVVEAYMEEIVTGDKMARLKQRDMLNEHYSKSKVEYRDLAASYHELAKQMGANSSQTAEMRKKLLTMKLESLIQDRNELERRQREHELRVRLLEQMRDKGKEGGVEPSSGMDHLVEEELARDPEIAENQKRLSDLKLMIKEQEYLAANPNHFSVAHAKRQAAALEEQIAERRAEVQPQVAQKLAEMMAHGSALGTGDPEAILPQMETEGKALAQYAEAADKRIAAALDEFKKLDTETADLENRETQIEDLKVIIKRINYQLNLWNLELDAEQRIKIADPAQKPSSDDAFQKLLGVCFAGIVGFGMVLFGIAYIEFQSRRLNSVQEVKEGLGLQVVGELPTLSGRTWRKIRSGTPAGIALEASLAESVDNIRTRLLHASGVESPRMIMVTSPEPREGKTTLASQLATSLARSGRRTLLVDGDVRNPTVHRVFELSLEPGLCEILRGEVERAAALQPSRTAQLWVLSAGRCCLESVQALSQSALQELLSALRSEFEFVVIDAAPVLKLADPLLFGQHVDVALLSVLRDVSKTPEIYEAVERLKSVGIAVLGTVVNGVSDGARRYHSGQLAMRARPPEASS